MPEYFTSDFDMWSMADLLAVKSGTLQRLLLSIVSRCERHILACEVKQKLFAFASNMKIQHVFNAFFFFATALPWPRVCV